MATTKRFTMFQTNTIEILVSGSASGGTMSVFTETCPAGYAVPTHAHAREDEYLMIMEGKFEMFDGQSWMDFAASGCFFPHGTLHGWRNVGTTEGKLMACMTPGGFEGMLEAVAPLQMPRDGAQAAVIAARYGLTMPPPGLN